MAGWIVERGIGEVRAALVDGDTVRAAFILPDEDLRAGSVVAARLVAKLGERGQGIVAWDGGEAIVAPLPRGVTVGATTLVEITRPAISEIGKPKRARARPAGPGAVAGAAGDALPPDAAVQRHTDPDRLEAAGWSDLLVEAAEARVDWASGSLTIAVTPAMTLIDVDGTIAPDRLAIEGAGAAAAAIRRLDIGGSIGIDLPTGESRAARQAAGDAIDAVLPQPFERTAVNGFGFVQIVRPRRRRSILELYAADAPAAHARALLRRAERCPGAGERTITAHPRVIATIAERPAWTAALAGRCGTPVALRGDPALAISAGYVQARHA